MTEPAFTKHYSDPTRAAAAVAHHRWISELGSARTPALITASEHHLRFEHLGAVLPDAQDLDRLADTLGRVHATAYTTQLRTARLDQPHTAPHGLCITDFVSPRRATLDRIPLLLKELPVAFYKDANIRNFMITADGIALVDFDDLTLAPFGYDLAKLILSTAMTFGPIQSDTIERSLSHYNTHTRHLHHHAECTIHQLQHYLEFHHHLTARYLHTNGYRYCWPVAAHGPSRRQRGETSSSATPFG
ncbi:phosphotransferase [Nocardia brasiliensis]|uniref:phosphotransferase n=1 Tax=Nocardia brasiliensis TaxID=37326 RepID=UPI003790A45E